MKKLNNKGFTIVELVIVVAVIAILAAVLIPTISGLIKTAQTSADVTLVKNVNLILATERALEGKNTTMQEALDDALEGGYDVTKLTPTNSDNYILWDQESDNFVLFANGKYNNAGAEVNVTDEYKLWNIADKTEGSKYSVYYTGKETTVNVNGVGFDAGTSSVAVVNYTSSVANDVIINTNGGTLNVGTEGEVAKGTIYHNGTLVAANVYTESNSFHTSGKIASLNLQAGKVVVENGAVVGLSAAAESTTLVSEGGELFLAAGADMDDIKATGSDLVKESFTINSKADLIAFRDAWNNGTAFATDKFTLNADIDLSGENWTPIGNWKYPFHGTFDGNGKTISGLTATTTNSYNGFGFFGIVGEGDTVIKDLTFTGVNINLEKGENVGAVVGYAPEKDKANNGDVIDSVGTLTLSGVTVSGNVNAQKHVGGLVGDSRTASNVTFIDCVNNADIKATDVGYTGGIIGYVNKSANLTLTNCINNGDITVTGSGAYGVGGLCTTADVTNITITSCENNGNISSGGPIAGLLNTPKDKTVSISGCKVTGIIKTTGNYGVHVLCNLPDGDKIITVSNTTFTGIVECAMNADVTALQAYLDGAIAPNGYSIASIEKAEKWTVKENYEVAGGTIYHYDSEKVHPVGYVAYNESGSWTQIEGTNIEFMAVSTGYYVFRTNNYIYAKYTTSPSTDYRPLSECPDNGVIVPKS